MPSIQDLDGRFPIVNPDGTPTTYLLRLLNDRGDSQTGTDTEIAELASQIDGKADKTTEIIAGSGLSGGGDLSEDRTINLDPLSLDDLTDVDLTTTPPTDGQVMAYVAADNEWVPANQSGGGGGGGSGKIILSPQEEYDGSSSSNFATKGLQGYFSRNRTCSKIVAFMTPASGATYKAFVVELDGSTNVTAVLAESSTVSGLPTTQGAYEFDFTECTITAGVRTAFLIVRTDGTGSTPVSIGYTGGNTVAVNAGADDVYSIRATVNSIAVSTSLNTDSGSCYLACPELE
ncbi:MAG: hypothetical protein Tp1125DCM00d2C21254131_46 [Prokaryotic dsDNA virus sp.]|nr:MAG: hypothetical protein Tp1125DCM00d2C21254131_46 [Prokaryotic dsDNA virus sp.]|tara:strand:+ start:261 stop:1127 length:867 start_codon:yes stop_codon:yes gene_type:complete